jgi:hypothetical protein
MGRKLNTSWEDILLQIGLDSMTENVKLIALVINLGCILNCTQI